MQLMNPFYIILFFLLVLQCTVFIVVAFLPKSLQRSIVTKFTNSAKANAFWKVHVIISFVLILFFIDLWSTENSFQKQKLDIQMRGQHMGAELRKGYLSYTILKIQRNKYIVFTLFFATIATSVYFRVLHYLYQKERHLEIDNKSVKKTKDRK